MRNIILKFGALAVVLTAISANAQRLDQARVTVPFAFTAGGKSLPAGDYRVSFNEGRDVVTISGETASSVLLLTGPADATVDPQTFLQFQRYKDQWFLEQVTVAGRARQVSAKANRRLALVAGSDETISAQFGVQMYDMQESSLREEN